MLPVAAATATAGIIVGTVTLTGLGLKISGLIVDLAGGHLFLTVLYSALAIWMLGLAVPVTASYIIAAVMVAPAMTKVGVPDVAAHMFIFYYAVLSEVSPPTALSPFAAAAITGAKPVPTMMRTWKYTLPAFVFPVCLHLEPSGAGTAAAGAARRRGDLGRHRAHRHRGAQRRPGRLDSWASQHPGARPRHGGRPAAVLRGNGLRHRRHDRVRGGRGAAPVQDRRRV